MTNELFLTTSEVKGEVRIPSNCVQPKYFITDLSNATLLIWFTVLVVLALFLYCFLLLCVFMT